MVTSHATETDHRGRPLAPSAGFMPHPDITRLAETWLLRTRVEETPPDHFRTVVQERPPSRQVVLDCVTCGRGLFILSPDIDRLGYQVNVMQAVAAVISHLHAHHEGTLNGRGHDTYPRLAQTVPGGPPAGAGGNGRSGGGAGDRPADQTGHHHPDAHSEASAGRSEEASG